MKKYFFILISYIISIKFTYAADGGILGNFAEERTWTDITDFKTTETALRNWDIHTGDIPIIITWAINFFMGIAGTIAIIFVIVWAYKILFWALSQDKTKWKDTIIMALTGFAIASLSWFIIRMIIDNLSS